MENLRLPATAQGQRSHCSVLIKWWLDKLTLKYSCQSVFITCMNMKKNTCTNSYSLTLIRFNLTFQISKHFKGWCQFKLILIWAKKYQPKRWNVSQHSAINEVLCCFRDVSTYKSFSLYIKDQACLVCVSRNGASRWLLLSCKSWGLDYSIQIMGIWRNSILFQERINFLNHIQGNWRFLSVKVSKCGHHFLHKNSIVLSAVIFI